MIVITQEGLVLETTGQLGKILLVERQVIAIRSVHVHDGIEVERSEFSAFDLLQHRDAVLGRRCGCQAGITEIQTW
ncbi:MAG: hypothetical protein ABSG01_16090 [Anaerolineales bacterium]